MFLPRVISRFPVNQWINNARGWVAFDADGTAFAVPLTVLDSDGTSYVVPRQVLDADGTAYNPA